MRLIRGFAEPSAWRNGYVAIGNFDGVHRGHQAMLARLRSLAAAAGCHAAVLTFDPHPIKLLRPDSTPPSLSTLEGKTRLLGHYGVDFVIACPTDHNLLQLTPREFFDRIVCKQLDARGLVEGPDFRFGHDRAGDVRTLADLCRDARLTLDVVDPVHVDEYLVSSSVIREMITRGAVADAVRLLGHPYRVSGTVVAGAGRGRGLTVPTANLKGVETLLPAEGVYAGTASVREQTHAAAINLGPNPTFDDQQHKLEVHLIDASLDVYDELMHVDFVARVRAVRAFSGAEALREQLQRDIELIRELVNGPLESLRKTDHDH